MDPSKLPIHSSTIPFALMYNIEDPSELPIDQFSTSRSTPVFYDFLSVHNDDRLPKKSRMESMKLFWEQQTRAMETVPVDEFMLPPSRIRRAIKSHDEVKMVSKETPILFSKALELFIMDLTKRSWMMAEECMSETIRKSDIASAISQVHDFLVECRSPN